MFGQDLFLSCGERVLDEGRAGAVAGICTRGSGFSARTYCLTGQGHPACTPAFCPSHTCYSLHTLWRTHSFPRPQVSHERGKTMDMVVPSQGIWGTAGIGGLNIDPAIKGGWVWVGGVGWGLPLRAPCIRPPEPRAPMPRHPPERSASPASTGGPRRAHQPTKETRNLFIPEFCTSACHPLPLPPCIPRLQERGAARGQPGAGRAGGGPRAAAQGGRVRAGCGCPGKLTARVFSGG